MKEATNPDPVIRQQLAKDIRDACINVGFFYGMIIPRYLRNTVSHASSAPVKNHGIPEDDIQGAVEAGKKFFALPTETKMEVRKLLCSTIAFINSAMSFTLTSVV